MIDRRFNEFNVYRLKVTVTDIIKLGSDLTKFEDKKQRGKSQNVRTNNYEGMVLNERTITQKETAKEAHRLLQGLLH